MSRKPQIEGIKKKGGKRYKLILSNSLQIQVDWMQNLFIDPTIFASLKFGLYVCARELKFVSLGVCECGCVSEWVKEKSKREFFKHADEKKIDIGILQT